MQNTRKRHVRRESGEWKELIRQHEKSGLSIESFCQQEGIAKSTFSKWRNKLSSEIKKNPSDFVELQAAQPEQSPLRVEIQFTNGSVLRVC